MLRSPIEDSGNWPPHGPEQHVMRLFPTTSAAEVPTAYRHPVRSVQQLDATLASSLDLARLADEDIAADYTMSADAMSRRLAWLQVNDPAGAATMAGQPAGWLAAPTEVMLTMLRHLTEVHGGAESYLADHGVDRSTFDTLRYLLLV